MFACCVEESDAQVVVMIDHVEGMDLQQMEERKAGKVEERTVRNENYFAGLARSRPVAPAEKAVEPEPPKKEQQMDEPEKEHEQELQDRVAVGAGVAVREIAEATHSKRQTKLPTVLKALAKIKLVDANGLALTCFAFSTWMFFAFLCNVDEVGGKNNGVFYMGDMLSWGVSMGLLISGIVQGLNGDHLGFTSYVFHAPILGTIGRNFKLAVSLGPDAAPFHLIGFFCYAAAWFNCIFTVMAFRIAKMFGVLYASVGLMFLLVGMNFEKLLGDAKDATDKTGDYIAGVSCLIVSLQCCYLIVPVMTGKAKIV
mmetsp:Transcript_121652/g.389436  ORF Transcript_121652/g.389436 Transcript_121652/m.389436 type:complete len:312 (-) Transcript_121652:301-1236(-)